MEFNLYWLLKKVLIRLDISGFLMIFQETKRKYFNM